jgi:LacI family transcriptional regulator/LacI family repressor for deo operon, udp, cdd, tsx, nupC, and nupG
VSIREVAARAGVSPATVSRVFTHAATVSAATRRRVEEAAKELAYEPNPVASSLARGRTGNLGLVVPDIANSFASVIAKAVHREARAAGYALFIAGSDRQSDEEFRLARAMAAQVDGLLMMSPRISDELFEQLAAVTPLAVINRVVDGCPAVLIPTADGMNQAVDHLHALGHRRIVYLAGSRSYSNTTRVGGFRAACTRLNLESTEIDLDDSRFSAGVRAGDLVIANGATAVVAYNDEIAVGVMSRLAYRGVGVPRDVSVIGFDDTGLAEMAIPLLTSVRLPAATAGAAGVRMLLDRVNGRGATVATEHVYLPTELVIRSTTAPIGRRSEDQP